MRKTPPRRCARLERLAGNAKGSLGIAMVIGRVLTGGSLSAQTPAPARFSQLTTVAVSGGDFHVVYRTSEHIEAPNWSPDGKWLVFNAGGQLLRMPSDGGAEPSQIPTGDVKKINNDHVISPDGRTIYFSAGGSLYAVPFEGGQPRRISNVQAPGRKFQCYLHGVSPDNKTIAYVGVEAARGNARTRNNLYTIPVTGGTDTRLSNRPMPDDGPEYSPDGKWIYFNSELNADIPGHAQCYRMAPDGTAIEQLTHFQFGCGSAALCRCKTA